MGYRGDGSYESAYEPTPPESRPGVMHRGVIGGGTVSRPDLPSIPDLEPAETFGRRHVLAALAVFGVIVVALATWGRDARSARAGASAAEAAAGAVSR